MVVSPKNSLLNVALRMLVASPLALSAPTGTSATEPLLALERIDQPSDLQPVGASDLYPPGAGAFGKRIKARKGVNIESYQWQKAFPDPHSDHYNNDWDKMESQRREISKKIKELTKHYVNVKNMGTIHEGGESSDEVVAQLHQTILKVTWIHDWLLNEYRRNVLKSSSSPFALTLATVTHQPGKEWVWETEDLFDGIWKELSQVQRETPNETSDPHLLAFHSTLSKIVPLLGNFMTVHKLKSPEFIENNFVLTLRPEDLVNLIDSFARSRHEILDDLKLYLASKDDLLRSFMIKPEKHASSIIDLNFMMSSESLKLFREGIKVLNNEDKQLAVLACEQGMLSQMKQASDALRKLRERSRFVGSNHTANRAKRHDLRG